MRIEDVDVPRSDRRSERDILEALAVYGFTSDRAVPRQSERSAAYADALARLAARGLVYECACTRRDLARMRAGPLGESVYARVCRDGVPEAIAHRSQRSLRVDVNDARIAYVDRLQGTQQQHLASDVGDFVLRRGDGLYAYQLAVVVDDAEQGITHVVRGADLLASTPRQIYLQRELGYPTPSYLHIPVAIDAHGQKLSKQTRARALPLDAPLPALRAAWSFLQQRDCAGVPSVAAFWRFAAREWDPHRLPPTRMLPAPREA